MNYVTDLPLFANKKNDSYDLIFFIINGLTKIVQYKLVKITINAPKLAKIIINIVIWHYDLPDSIISDLRAIFMSKFWFSLYYFLGSKRPLSTTFYS